MIKSMTGFGRATEQIDGLNITVEIKSVNNRYFDFTARMPGMYRFAEEALKSICQKSVTRGKVELSVMVEDRTENSTVVEVNEELAAAYLSALKSLGKKYHLKNDLGISALVGQSDLFRVTRQQMEEEKVSAALCSVTEKAVESFLAMRKTEGEKLKDDILSKADSVLEKVAFVESKSPETVKAYRERLEQKMRELLGDASVDEQRLITETGLFADKIAVDEETVRLRSHIDQLRKLLDSQEATGKKLDFLVQEMNRETNTIGSKSQNVEIAHTVVDMKSDIEKIREQIQNIE